MHQITFTLHTCGSVGLETDTGSPLLSPGIAEMSYDLYSSEFTVETTRYEDGVALITQSEMAFVRTSGPRIRYLNFFDLKNLNPKSIKGFSHGEFARDVRSFAASIALENEKTCRGQNAERIPHWKVKSFKKKFGRDQWKEKFLESEGYVQDFIVCDGYEKELLNLIDNLSISDDERECAKKELKRYRDKITSSRYKKNGLRILF